jgi:hypothetical protein
MKKRQHVNKSLREGPPSGATSYSGPVHVRRRDDVLDVNLYEGYSQSVTCSSSVYTNNSVFASSAVTGAPNWSDYSSAYLEFRVVGMTVKWFPTCLHSTAPNQPYSTASPMFLCPSSIDQTPISGDLAAWAHEGKRCAPSNEYVRCSIKMRSTNDANWNTCASGTTNTLCIKSFITGKGTSASAVVALGYFYLEYNVQFRRSAVNNTSLSTPFSSPLFPFPILAKPDEKENKQQKISNELDVKDNAKTPKNLSSVKSQPMDCTEDGEGTWIYTQTTSKDSLKKPKLLKPSVQDYALPHPVTITGKCF